MLFIYARRKPLMFHTNEWLDELRQRKENRVVEFDTGHWIMLQQPQRFNEVVGDWLAGR
jgi:pimeloyl-ACP methyl ester carboxylesterase